MRPFHVEAVHSLPFGQGFPGAGQIAEASHHIRGRTGDHRGIEARHASSKLGMERARDFFMRGLRVIVIHCGETIDLQIDPAGRQVKV